MTKRIACHGICNRISKFEFQITYYKSFWTGEFIRISFILFLFCFFKIIMIFILIMCVYLITLQIRREALTWLFLLLSLLALCKQSKFSHVKSILKPFGKLLSTPTTPLIHQLSSLQISLCPHRFV